LLTNYRACLEVVNNRVKVHINGWPLVFDGGQVEHTITNLGVANYITLSEHSAADAVPAITTFDNLAISDARTGFARHGDSGRHV